MAATLNFLVLIVFININFMNGLSTWVDYRLALVPNRRQLTLTSITPVVCIEPGLVCGFDCESVYLCTKTEKGFVSYLTQTCKGDTTCSNGKCSTVPSHECSSGAQYPFICNSLDGVYPDPADCTKYHYCVPNGTAEDYVLEHFEAKCDENYAYNPRTTYCDIPLVDGECRNNLVPVCRSPAQTGQVSENPSLYYICLPYVFNPNVLYPYLQICAYGKEYNGNYACETQKPGPPKPPT